MHRVNKSHFVLALAFSFSGALPGAAPVDAASVNSLALKATYEVSANFSWATRAVSVQTTARVTNPTGGSVSTVAFNLGTLRTGKANVGVVTVRGNPVNETIQDQTVLVPFSPPLGAGSSADVVINYNATLAAKAGGYKWQFVRKGGVMTAYRWIPWLSRTAKFANVGGGEQYVTPSSTSVEVAIRTDRPLDIASSGRRTSVNGLTQTFVAHNVRDFNFSAAPDYQTSSRTTNGTTITFFYRTLPPARVLDKAVQGFNFLTNNVGAYPEDFLNIAEVGPWYGMESPNLNWIPRDAGSLLDYMVVHEVAHEWFYSTVGNDQALDPFADEAVAEFLGREIAGTWKSSKCPGGNLDRTIYSSPGDCYVAVVYYQGYKYLQAYRQTVVAADFWQGLRNYYNAYKFKIGSTRKLLDALDAAANYHPNHAARFPSLYP